MSVHLDRVGLPDSFKTPRVYTNKMTSFYSADGYNDAESIRARIAYLEGMDDKYAGDNPGARQACIDELRAKLADLEE